VEDIEVALIELLNDFRKLTPEQQAAALAAIKEELATLHPK